MNSPQRTRKNNRFLYQLGSLHAHNRDGSQVTQHDRYKILMLLGQQLIALGYHQVTIQTLKQRHANALVYRVWKPQGVSDETIANRLAVFRWVLEKVRRPSAIPASNAAFGLAPRRRVATVSKAIVLEDRCLAQVDDGYIQMSLELQRAWGLRRKECLMLQPWAADGGDRLILQGSWCKNGRPREVPLVWPEQRDVLDRAKTLVRFKSHSMIPQALQYHQQRNRYTAWARKLGLPPLHGLRHAFAQRRYAMLAGFPCPLQQGPTWDTMTPAQREADQEARQQVSRELGHERCVIVSLYIGAARTRS